MKNSLLTLTLLLFFASSNIWAIDRVYDENSLHDAVFAANHNANIKEIIFEDDATIYLTAPVIYHGSQSLSLIGNNATIDGSAAGSFVLDTDLTAITQDGALVFNTQGNIRINKLTVKNSATRGIVINVPVDAKGEDINISLNNVNIINSALYGLHIDDNTDAFDDGALGSAIGIELHINNSSFIANGTGAIDFDGIRVDERDQGNIVAIINNTHIDGNGGDGIELDEAGNGDVYANMVDVTLNDNGFYNPLDLDDGFDIDEADDGNIEVSLFNVIINNNKDEGLDFDEEGNGDIDLKLNKISAENNSDEAIKVDEQDSGNIISKLNNVTVIENGDDGIQLTEIGLGYIETTLRKVTAIDNNKYGIKIEQWFIEDETSVVEDPGFLTSNKLSLYGNEKGDQIRTHNILIK